MTARCHHEQGKACNDDARDGATLVRRRFLQGVVVRGIVATLIRSAMVSSKTHRVESAQRSYRFDGQGTQIRSRTLAATAGRGALHEIYDRA